MADPIYEPTRRGLLRDATGAGVGLAGLGLVGCELAGGDTTTEAATATDAATPSCTLSPELTEGPYYLDLDKIRRDITEDRPGLPLDLRVKVVDASTCKAIEDAAVEIWHADAGGTYSGFSQEGTEGKTYLRGVQLTGESGVARFLTVYPGWYAGRAIHIHLKTHLGGRAAGRTFRGGHTVHTGQLFFNDSVSDRVVRLSPYSGRSGARVRNGEDSIYAEAGSGSLLRLRRRKASTIRKGMIGTITLGVDSS
jgi:protocatechuate 3,4-dioxygenase beta subunit